MFTSKRFSAAQLRRWTAAGRGTGTFDRYLPWHAVSRDDPPSRGQSRIVCFSSGTRQLAFLSKREYFAFLFAALMPQLLDIREQFPLSTNDAGHELESYTGGRGPSYAGTLRIATDLRMRHPMLADAKGEVAWRLTTDFLLTRRSTHGPRAHSLLAVAIKPCERRLSERARDLLRIEEQYWRERNVPWRLITNDSYDLNAARGLAHLAPWAFGDWRHDPIALRTFAQRVTAYGDCTLQTALALAGPCERGFAQALLAQALWRGYLAVDLAQLVPPTPRVRLISVEHFVAQSPFASWSGSQS